ncbi:hypothetical protein [Micromonospora sp. NPDC023888]|uniref:hypothetical protein n=1 Tax=Micromonospora sp. NPDC023888 TaxID=3155607 RepID=UPI0033F9ECAA
MDVKERSRRAVASLQGYLAPLEFTDWSAARVTSELTRQVLNWGAERGWRVRREVPSIAGLPGPHPDRPGYLDVVCQRLDGPPIAIEIDRTDKQWSSRKLRCEADAGAIPLWVRWNDAKTWIVPDPIGVVQVPTIRRRAAGRLLYSRAAAEHTRRTPLTQPVPPVEETVVLQPAGSAWPSAHCSAVTTKGEPCMIDPRPSGLCHVHDPAVQCGAINRKGRRCTIATGGGRCKRHQDVDGDGAGLFARPDTLL